MVGIVFVLLLLPAARASTPAGIVWAASSVQRSSNLLSSLSPLVSTVFGPNVRANSDSTTYGQHEPSLAVSRVHTNTVVVTSKDYRVGNVKQMWIDSSTDGGATWPVGRQLQVPGIPGALNNQSDGVVMARDDGRIYVACLGVRAPAGDQGGVYITWTDDDGSSWHSPSVQANNPIDPYLDDKDWFAIDNNPASPFYHRMYMMYAPNAATVNEQHSTDGGLTWTSRQQISGNNTEYAYPVVGSDGTVYNFMMYQWGANNNGIVQLTKSTDGGITWSSPQTVSQAMQAASPIRAGDQFRFFSIISAAIDPNTGALYAAWTDNRNFATDGTDVLYVKSTDGGTTWSTPARLSHDPTGIVRDHITPMITVGADSRLHAFWLDRRLDPANHLFDSWYSSSTDGGTTWDPDTRVSTQSQNMDVGFPPGSGNAAGDYWGLDTAQDSVYVAWNDSRSGNQDILVSKGLISSGGGGTNTPVATFTSTALSNTATPTVVASTSTATQSPSTTTPQSPSPTPTQPLPTATQPTSIPTSATPSSTSTVAQATATSLSTGVPSATLTSTATACLTHFADVSPAQPFYPYVQCLVCRGIVSGYACGGVGEPCVGLSSAPYFRPGSFISRGQISKIVSNSAGFNEDPGVQIYEDIPAGSPFYIYINRLSNHSVMSGYACGGAGEPCVAPANRPYFRPSANASRGQLAKVVSNAAGFNDVPTPVFAAESLFDLYSNRLGERNIVSGYACGDINPETGQSEPCDAQNRPYYRSPNRITRGQASKIVANSFFPECSPGPARSIPLR
ncbi:MAG: S-layer homology domain-containing protein [Chloroflexota bacterium]|nr:S-layer homology domain-containing protein [Chloroflexota bacterium]